MGSFNRQECSFTQLRVDQYLAVGGRTKNGSILGKRSRLGFELAGKKCIEVGILIDWFFNLAYVDVKVLDEFLYVSLRS